MKIILVIALILTTISCKKEKVKSSENIIEKIKPLKASSKEEIEIFNKAVRNGDMEKVKKVMYAQLPEAEANSLLDELVKEYGTANVILWSSAPIGDLDSVKKAIEFGADVDIEVRGSSTPLLSSTQAQHMEIVKVLLKNKADPNKRGKGGETPLSLAVGANNKELISLLLKAGASFTRGGDPTYKEFSILTVALSQGNLEMVKFLIEKGANPNGGNGLPLAFSIMLKNSDAIKLLVSNGANINYSGKKGFRPLMTAVIEADKKIIKTLLDLGADPKLKDEQGMDAYAWAKKYKSKGGDILKELISEGQKNKK